MGIITSPSHCLSFSSPLSHTVGLFVSAFALLPWHLSISPLQSVFVFSLKAPSLEPKETAVAEPEQQDEVFGKRSLN